MLGINWTLREMLEFAAKEGVGAKGRYFELSGLNELVEAHTRGE